MKWSLILTIAALCPALAHAVLQKSAKHENPAQLKDRISHIFGKGHKKRGLFSPVPTFSQGIDYATVKHSVLKPFVVDYPVKSVPLGVKIPFRAPSNNVRYPLQTGQQIPYPTNIQKPSNLNHMAVKPAWPVSCPNPTNPPVHHIIPAPPVVPLFPTSTVHVQPAILPAPALAPILPLPHPPIPFATRPIIKPIIPVAQHIPVAPVVHPTPTFIRPGNSLHTSFFATYPKHPFIHSAPIHPAPVHHVPIHPAPVHHVPIHPAPIHPVPIHPTPIHPAPILPLFNQHVPLNLIHPPVNLGHIPLHPHRFAINPFHAAPHPHPHPHPHLHPNPGTLNVGHFPVANINTIATNIPLGSGHNIQFLQTNPSVNPSVQEQSIQNIQGLQHFSSGATNAWTPMSTSQSLPNLQYPQPQFIQENESPLHQQQDGNENQQNTEYNEGYQYQQNPGPQFNEINQHYQHQQFQQEHQQFQHEQQQQQQYQEDQYSGNLQHEPQIPQTLPNHPLSGRPINEAFQDHIPLRQHLPFAESSENFAGYP